MSRPVAAACWALLLLFTACLKPAVRKGPPVPLFESASQIGNPEDSAVSDSAVPESEEAPESAEEAGLPDIETPPPPPQPVYAPKRFEPFRTDNLPGYGVARNTVRVYLLPARRYFSLGLDNAVSVYAGNASCGILQGSTTFRVDRDGVVFSNKPDKIPLPVTLVPVKEGSIFRLNEKSYRGRLVIQNTSAHNPILINEVRIEDYLKGVVPYEIGKRDTGSYEALKVQAIMARTYTYARLGSHNSDGFDLYPDESDQVYNGTQGEYPLSNQAVDETRDLVVTCNDTLIQAFYYSTSSGRTANIEEVWPERGYKAYCRSVNDSIYNIYSGYFNWVESWRGDVLERIVNLSLKPLFSDFRKGRLQDIAVENYTSCGRVKTLAITVAGRTYRIYGDKVRWALKRSLKGNPILRSSYFRLDVQRDKKGILRVVARGKGFGHGVGMSQMGALGMAAAGKRFDEIIHAYYTGVDLARVTY